MCVLNVRVKFLQNKTSVQIIHINISKTDYASNIRNNGLVDKFKICFKISFLKLENIVQSQPKFKNIVCATD
jgi:hypothetical protein